MKLFFIRKLKLLFLRCNLHVFVEPFSGFLLNLVYLSKLSRWRKNSGPLRFNDFYSPKWDYQKRYELYTFLLDNEGLDEEINYLEFGVAQGRSFRWWVEHSRNEDSEFFGFDTFTGLPEDWDLFEKGAMSAKGEVPSIDDSRVHFIKGLFQETLPDFLERFDRKKRNVIHLDADLYTSTLYVLTSLAPFLKTGDILIFDEFVVPQHEFLAFSNFVSSYYIDYELIAAANNYYFIAVKVK